MTSIPAPLPKAAETLLASLIHNRAALQWRGGTWHILGPKTDVAKALPKSRTATIGKLRDAGRLKDLGDGLLRPTDVGLAPVVMAAESPLARLAAATKDDGTCYFDSAQLQAGERLRRDFEQAHWAPRVTASYAPVEGQGNRHAQMSDNAIENLNDNAIAARNRVHAAMSATGPELASILYHVCCLVAGLEMAERQLTLPRRSGKAVLGLALARLARHYGLKPPLAHGGPAKIGHWAVTDYRPGISPPQQRPL